MAIDIVDLPINSMVDLSIVMWLFHKTMTIIMVPITKPLPKKYKPSRTLRREVCCENCLVYKKQGHPDVVCAIPRRLEMAQEKGLLKLGAGEASHEESKWVSLVNSDTIWL